MFTVVVILPPPRPSMGQTFCLWLQDFQRRGGGFFATQPVVIGVIGDVIGVIGSVICVIGGVIGVICLVSFFFSTACGDYILSGTTCIGVTISF